MSSRSMGCAGTVLQQLPDPPIATSVSDRLTARRRWIGAAMAAGGTLLFRRDAASADTRASERVLRIVGQWEIAALDPASSGYLFLRMQAAETLVNADQTGRLTPGLATHWQRSNDGLRWRFQLRDSARFHDGTPVSAPQVAAVLQRAARGPGLLRLAPVRDIRPLPGAVEFVLSSPFAVLPAVLSHSSTLILAAASFDTRGAVVQIIGSGAYRPVTVETQKFTLAASTTFDGPQATIRQASYLKAGRSETRALMAESGEAELAFGLDPASVERLRRGSKVRLETVTIPRTAILKVNAGHRWLADRRARQAISLALNRNGIARALLRDAELAAGQLFPPVLAHWHAHELAPLGMNVARARQLWAQLGWQPGRDGILQRGAERLSFTLRTFPDRPELPLMATAIQEQLRQSGVEVRVAIGNSGEIPARHRDGTLELALAARNYGLLPDPLATLLQDFGSEGGDWGAMNWRHADLPALLNELNQLDPGATAGDSRTDALRRRVVQILHEDLPVIPVSWYRQNAAVSPQLTEVALDPLERSYGLTGLRWTGAAVKTADAQRIFVAAHP